MTASCRTPRSWPPLALVRPSSRWRMQFAGRVQHDSGAGVQLRPVRDWVNLTNGTNQRVEGCQLLLFQLDRILCRAWVGRCLLEYVVRVEVVPVVILGSI